MIPIRCAAVRNCCAAFSYELRGRAAAQLRGNIDSEWGTFYHAQTRARWRPYYTDYTILQQIKTDGALQPEDISSVVSGWQWHNLTPSYHQQQSMGGRKRELNYSVSPNKGFSSFLQPLLNIW